MSKKDRQTVPDSPARRAQSESLLDSQYGLKAFTGVVPFRPPAGSLEAQPENDPAEIPDRYEIRDGEDGHELRCKEAPGVSVQIDREIAVSEADSRKLGERVILLDGAGQFGPMIDDARHVYNLDHHDACVRAFTLSTCEQALILVLKGLELDQGDWTILANEPDLDTCLAIWVLLNYRRVRELSPEARDRIVPLLRLEGAIDANGLEIAEFCGLPTARWAVEKERIDRLFAYELEAKQNGTWQTMDLSVHTANLLRELDRWVYEATDFDDFTSVETEHGHVEIGGNRVAVICRDSAGIYDVEKRLKAVWGDRLGLIALEKGQHHYTLRRVASLSGIDLEEAYARLNLLDPVVDGRPPEKRWGGSDDIGGSPRPQGTGLTPREIARILRLTYREQSLGIRLQRVVMAILWVLLTTGSAALAIWARRLWLPLETLLDSDALAASADLAVAGLTGIVISLILTRQLSRGWTWLFGWRWPAGEDWLALVPVGLAASAVGGMPIPGRIALDAESLSVWAAATLLWSGALALIFPGLVHGLLILEGRTQSVRGPWFVSRAAWFSGVFFALAMVLLSHFWLAGSPLPIEALGQRTAIALGALTLGMAAAMVRERSLSVWPAIGLLFAGAVTRLLVGIWF